MSELKPCPCCGCQHPAIMAKMIFKSGSPLGFRIECQDCRLMTCWWHTEEEASEAWNTRHGEGE
jgi:hypothetical protein